jgi:hypothetical protein
MRIGLDIDGVHADFAGAFTKLIVRVTGKDLFQRGDGKNPPSWDWFFQRGYTKDEVKLAWDVVKSPASAFWLNLEELPGCAATRLVILDLLRWHDVYFITNRPGANAKWQTEQWLRLHLQIDHPTVLLASEKGMTAKALNLDCYLDDYYVNVDDVIAKTTPYVGADARGIKADPTCRTYLLNASYNRSVGVDDRVTRVESVGQFYDAELHNL